MTALFVGGPANGSVRDVGSPMPRLTAVEGHLYTQQKVWTGKRIVIVYAPNGYEVWRKAKRVILKYADTL